MYPVSWSPSILPVLKIGLLSDSLGACLLQGLSQDDKVNLDLTSVSYSYESRGSRLSKVGEGQQFMV